MAESPKKPLSGLRRRYKRCLVSFENLYLYLREYVDNARNNVYFTTVLLTLLILPGSAIYMGATNIHECPGSSETPLQVTLLGILGCVVLITRIVNLMLRARGNVSREPFLMVVTALSAIATFSFFLAHITTFFNTSVDFDNSSENYCNKLFYGYIYYTNFVVIGISLLIVLLHFPYVRLNLRYTSFYDTI
ncbi:hypothetical protein TNIN_71 [Trichonephila inaurata madagascariensis]|uniref:Uncharacterized protein n=1 Tax=Trichonephila inaurata madagascariensis TaxID=2747483 RepID=A0A8X7C256_9ARAC|nr:hypothetical protein TNIN_71 [Trichonephila inaurata madagascariensis]